MNITIFTDPVKIGPGIWFKMHIDAVKATTDNLKEAFEININNTCDNFKCKKCQIHFRRFIDMHPFHKYWKIIDSQKRDIGFFKWTWELHNEVNKFLGKVEPGLEEAYNFFSNVDEGACFNCNSVIEHSSTPIINEDNLEQRSRAIPQILTLYRSANLKPQPFGLNHKH